MEPWLPESCRQDQAEEPAWVPRGTCVLQIGNPREPPPFPGQSFPSAAPSSPPQTTCEQNKPDPAAPRCCSGSEPVRKAAQNLPVPDILSVWLFNVTASHGETRRHGNAVLIISLPYWEASFTRAAIPSPVPSLATAEARGDIKLFSGTSLLVFSSVSTPHPTAPVCGKVGIRKGRLPVAARILSYGR